MKPEHARYRPPDPFPPGLARSQAKISATEPPRFSGLVEPPREVPLPVRLSTFFGGFHALFGWIFFGVGMVFVWIFGFQIDFTSWCRFLGDVETAPGTVREVRETNFSENDVKVYEIAYTFAVAEKTYEGRSYVRGGRFREGNVVTIEYPKGDPSTSRIQGTRRDMAPIWVSFVFIFLLIGLAFIVYSIRTGIKANRLLAQGKLGRGVLKSKEATRTQVNNQTVYKLTFEFVAEDGQTYEAVAKTHETAALQDEPEEPLLYDPLDPSYAVMLDSLPGRPEVDESGNLKSARPVRSLLGLVLPAAVVLGHGTYVYLHFLV